jgi:hypothetical protein
MTVTTNSCVIDRYLIDFGDAEQQQKGVELQT